jgi:hypothetical protein
MRPVIARVGLFCAIVAVAASWTGTPAFAEVLVAGRTYAAGTAVEAPSLGLAFITPQGWAGKFAQDANSKVLVMGSNDIEGVGLAILQTGQSPEQIAAGIAVPQNLGSGVILRATAPPEVQGSRVTARHQNNVYVGRALAVIGPNGSSVIFYFAGPFKNEAAYAQILEGLAQTTGFAPPVPAAAQAEAPAAGSLEGQWSKLLSGQMLHYFSTYSSGAGGGGMASHRVLHLCSDGRYAFGGESSMSMNVPGANASGSGRSGARGQWRIEAPTQTTAVLVLTADGGAPMRWQVRYDGSKTFLNGQRWSRVPSDACR